MNHRTGLFSLSLTTFVGFLVAVWPTRAEDMLRYLTETQKLAASGKHEEALERFLWFHEHALEHDPNMIGVRLSFALMSWHELGKKYPPALTALEATRDRAEELVKRGEGGRLNAHDVLSINRELNEVERSIELFHQLDKEQPSLAKQCWYLVKDAAIEGKKLDILKKYLGPIADEFDQCKKSYDSLLSHAKSVDEVSKRLEKFAANQFEEKCLQLIEVAVLLGDEKGAREVQTKALAVLDRPKLREALPPVEEEKKEDSAE